MKPASKKIAISNSPAKVTRWKPSRKPKPDKPKEPIVLCRIVPPVVACIPDLLDTPVPANYTPEQAVELLDLKIRNRLLPQGY